MILPSIYQYGNGDQTTFCVPCPNSHLLLEICFHIHEKHIRRLAGKAKLIAKTRPCKEQDGTITSISCFLGHIKLLLRKDGFISRLILRIPISPRAGRKPTGELPSTDSWPRLPPTAHLASDDTLTRPRDTRCVVCPPSSQLLNIRELLCLIPTDNI